MDKTDEHVMTPENQTFVNMDQVRKRIAILHAHNAGLVNTPEQALFNFVTTGVGIGIARRLWTGGGTSTTLYQGLIPYHTDTSQDLMEHGDSNGPFPPSVSEAAAVEMGFKAQERAQRLQFRGNKRRNITPEQAPSIVTIVATGAVQTDHARKGPDHVHFTCVNRFGEARKAYIVFDRVGWTRELEDLVVEIFLLNFALETVGIKPLKMSMKNMPGKLYSPDITFIDAENDRFILRPARYDAAHEMIARHLTREKLEAEPYFDAYGISSDHIADTGKGLCVIASSLDPLTYTHRWYEDWARKHGYDPVFNLEGHHPEKGDLPFKEMQRRISGILGRVPFVVTYGYGYFSDKAKRFPNATFLMGHDVAEKLLDRTKERWYNDLVTMRERGATIIVFPRRVTDKTVNASQLKTITDLDIPAEFSELFVGSDDLPPAGSSTEVRAALAPPAALIKS